MTPPDRDVSERLERFVDELVVVPWFQHVGAATPLPTVAFRTERAASVDAACAALAAPHWEDVTLEASNRLSSFLHDRHRDLYQRWNELTATIKSAMATTVDPAAEHLARTIGASGNLVDSVRWDVVHAGLEAAYQSCKPPAFFTVICECYRVGRLPCGWRGSLEDGTLLVW